MLPVCCALPECCPHAACMLHRARYQGAAPRTGSLLPPHCLCIAPSCLHTPPCQCPAPRPAHAALSTARVLPACCLPHAHSKGAACTHCTEHTASALPRVHCLGIPHMPPAHIPLSRWAACCPPECCLGTLHRVPCQHTAYTCSALSMLPLHHPAGSPSRLPAHAVLH